MKKWLFILLSVIVMIASPMAFGWDFYSNVDDFTDKKSMSINIYSNEVGKRDEKARLYIYSSTEIDWLAISYRNLTHLRDFSDTDYRIDKNKAEKLRTSNNDDFSFIALDRKYGKPLKDRLVELCFSERLIVRTFDIFGDMVSYSFVTKGLEDKLREIDFEGYHIETTIREVLKELDKRKEAKKAL